MIEVVLSDTHFSDIRDPGANLIPLSFDDMKSAEEIINTSLKQGLHVFIKEKDGSE